MKELILSNENLNQEVLLSFKGHNFLVKNVACGQYWFERRVNILLINDSLERIKFKEVGVLRLFDKDSIERESVATQCIIKGNTTFEECLTEAKKYIEKFVNFIEK